MADPFVDRWDPDSFQNPWKVFALAVVAAFIALVLVTIVCGCLIIPPPLLDEEAAVEPSRKPSDEADEAPKEQRPAGNAAGPSEGWRPGWGSLKKIRGLLSGKTKREAEEGVELNELSPERAQGRRPSPMGNHHRLTAQGAQARSHRKHTPSTLSPVAEMPPPAQLPYPRGRGGADSGLYPEDVDREADVPGRVAARNESVGGVSEGNEELWEKASDDTIDGLDNVAPQESRSGRRKPKRDTKPEEAESAEPVSPPSNE